MNEDPWKGSSAGDYGVLILGESHHNDGNDVGKPVTGTTCGVVQYYLDGNRGRWTRFFTNIAQIFGYKKEESKMFYDKVYFGNYMDRFGGINGDSKTKSIIKEHRIEYNDKLFQFINQNHIHCVVCFSKLVFWNLPGCGEGEKALRFSAGKSGKRTNWIESIIYKKNIDHSACDEKLISDVQVYAIRHPSAFCNLNQCHDALKGSDAAIVMKHPFV